MKKQDFFYLFLSLALLAISGYVYVTYGKSHIVPATKAPTKVVVKKVDDQAALIAELTKKLDDLAKAPNREALTALKPELDKLKASTQRDALMAKFDHLNAEVTRIADAEAALQAAKDNLNQENLTKAQDLINQIQTAGKKDELQARLNSLAEGFVPSSSSSSSEEETETETEAEEGQEETSEDTEADASDYVAPASTYTPAPQPAAPATPTTPATPPASQPAPSEPASTPSTPADTIVEDDTGGSASSTSGEGN